MTSDALILLKNCVADVEPTIDSRFRMLTTDRNSTTGSMQCMSLWLAEQTRISPLIVQIVITDLGDEALRQGSHWSPLSNLSTTVPQKCG